MAIACPSGVLEMGVTDVEGEDLDVEDVSGDSTTACVARHHASQVMWDLLACGWDLGLHLG